LNKAYKKVKSNKEAGGVDGMRVGELFFTCEYEAIAKEYG
jgi:hypothetical protein